MTFEALNDNVMLVELSLEEMKQYHITYETLESDNSHTQSAVKSILKVIKVSEKFNTTDKITVEALPIEDGGCFFIFTFSPRNKTRYKVKKNNEQVLFATEKTDNLLDFAGVLKSTCPKNQELKIFKMNNYFYMQIPVTSKKICALASEFGSLSSIDYERLCEFGENLGSICI